MILRWSMMAAGLLVAGAAFAQQGGTAAKPAAAAAGKEQAQTPPAPLTAADKPNLSYAIGFQIGADFVDKKLDIDINRVISAMQDGYAGRKPTVSEESMHDLLGRMQYQMYTKPRASSTRSRARTRPRARSSWPTTRSRRASSRCLPACNTA